MLTKKYDVQYEYGEPVWNTRKCAYERKKGVTTFSFDDVSAQIPMILFNVYTHGKDQANRVVLVKAELPFWFIR